MDFEDEPQLNTGCTDCRKLFNIPVSDESRCLFSLRCLLGIWVGGLVGLQGSLGGTGDDTLSLQAVPALVTYCTLFLAVLFGETGMLTRLVFDLDDNKEEGNSLVELEALFWNTSDDRECGLDAWGDNNGLWGDLGRDLAENGGLGVISDWSLWDDEGVVISFECVLGVRIFLDFCQEVLRKPEFRRGRFRNVSPNSSTEPSWKTRAKTVLSKRSKSYQWSSPTSESEVLQRSHMLVQHCPLLDLNYNTLQYDKLLQSLCPWAHPVKFKTLQDLLYHMVKRKKNFYDWLKPASVPEK